MILSLLWKLQCCRKMDTFSKNAMFRFNFAAFVIASFIYPGFVLGETLEKVMKESESCETSCDKTYPLHTYPSAEHLGCCKRGCRLYAMIDLVYNFQNPNITKESCMNSCMEAYSQTAECYACNLGCTNQVSFVNKKYKKAENIHLTPLLYIQTMYNSIVDRVSRLVTSSWTLYIQQDTGKMVVVHSQPQTVQDYLESEDAMESQELDFSDNHVPFPSRVSGTSLSQAYSRNTQKYGVAVSEYTREESTRSTERIIPSDWLGCISRQSGLPRWLLVMMLFMAIMVMVWLCCASTVTAVDQHLRLQNLTINGDLDYLTFYNPSEEIKIQPPQDEQAAILPLKVHLEQA